MALRKLTKREKIIFTICIISVLSYFGFNYVFLPLRAKINDLNNEISRKELKLKKSYKILGQKDSLEQTYKKYSAYVKQKDTDEQEMSMLLKEVDSVGKDIDISISNMKPLRVRAVDFYKKFSVELEAEGMLEDLTKFVHTLQSPPYLLKIEKLRIERRSMRTNNLKSFMLISRIRIP